MRPEEVLDRLKARGFGDADARILTDHFLDAEARGKRGHGLSRVEWLASLPDLDPLAQPTKLASRASYERWDGNGALGYLTLAAKANSFLSAAGRHTRPSPSLSASSCS